VPRPHYLLPPEANSSSSQGPHVSRYALGRHTAEVTDDHGGIVPTGSSLPALRASHPLHQAPSTTHSTAGATKHKAQSTAPQVLQSTKHKAQGTKHLLRLLTLKGSHGRPQRDRPYRHYRASHPLHQAQSTKHLFHIRPHDKSVVPPRSRPPPLTRESFLHIRFLL